MTGARSIALLSLYVRFVTPSADPAAGSWFRNANAPSVLRVGSKESFVSMTRQNLGRCTSSVVLRLRRGIGLRNSPQMQKWMRRLDLELSVGATWSLEEPTPREKTVFGRLECQIRRGRLARSAADEPRPAA